MTPERELERRNTIRKLIISGIGCVIFIIATFYFSGRAHQAELERHNRACIARGMTLHETLLDAYCVDKSGQMFLLTR